MWDDILDKIASDNARRGQLPPPSPSLLVEVWPTLAGEALATISSPVELRDGVLSMEVRERPLIEEWRRSPQILLRRLRRFCPWKIEELEFIHNPTLSPQGHRARRRSNSDDESEANPPDALERDSSTPPLSSDARDEIDDPELQALINAIDGHRGGGKSS